MKRTTIRRILGIALCMVTFSVASAQQLDSLRAPRLRNSCLQFGVGYSNILDTYLSDREYRGIDLRVAHETMRLTDCKRYKLSVQNFLQTDFSYTHNTADNNNLFTGVINWNYGLHRQFTVNDHLKLLAGGLSDMNIGFIYNLRNSNNPASLRAYLNFDASAMAIWRFRVKRLPMILRYQLNIPVIGVMFSPQMGESYYEIFSLGNHKGTVKITSLHNEPSLRQILSLDIPLGSRTLRVSYLGDIQQSHVNGIKTHIYSHVFMFGFVRQLYSFHPKEAQRLPLSLQVY
jgi:hypothetical protein